ncbi:unnamed protein product, partial [Mesorhabditis spiculigera]
MNTSYGWDAVAACEGSKTETLRGEPTRHVLVRWKPSWLPRQQIGGYSEIEQDIYIVHGPRQTDKDQPPFEQSWVVTRQATPEAKTETILMRYNEIKKRMPAELIEYFERIPVDE